MTRHRKISNRAVGVARRAGVQKTTLARRSFTRPLSYYAYKFPGGKFAFMEALRPAATDNPKIKDMVDRWFGLSKSDRRYICLDELAESVGIDARSVIVAVAVAAGPGEGGKLLGAILNRHNLVRRNILCALGTGKAAKRAGIAFMQYYGFFCFERLEIDLEDDT
jgi:hypothetical protein